MESIVNLNRNMKCVVAYFVTFFLAWMIRVVYIGPYFIEKFNNNIYIFTFLTESIRVLLFIGPILLYLRYIDGVNPISFLKLNVQMIKNIKIGILIGFLAILFAVIGLGYQHASLHIGKYWATALVIGLAEEIPFRGFLLQKFEEYLSFWKANCLTAFLFMAIHFPSYIFHNNSNMLIEGIGVFAWGLVFGFIFNKTKSLLPCIISHSMYDLACFILIGKS